MLCSITDFVILLMNALYSDLQNYLLGGTSSEKHADLDDDAKTNLLDVSDHIFNDIS